jgi:hypothetical protein
VPWPRIRGHAVVHDLKMSPPLRYVVLRHEGVDDPHFDLMFETSPGSDLATWRSNEWPITPTTPFTPLRPHRRAYLTYEGVISGDRGTVHRLHADNHTVEEDSPRHLVVKLETGQRLILPKGEGKWAGT